MLLYHALIATIDFLPWPARDQRTSRTTTQFDHSCTCYVEYHSSCEAHSASHMPSSRTRALLLCDGVRGFAMKLKIRKCLIQDDKQAKL